jgi:hypothetical protein
MGVSVGETTDFACFGSGVRDPRFGIRDPEPWSPKPEA